MDAEAETDSICLELQTAGHPLGDSPTLPARCYTDDGWLARERELIFGRAWVAVGREGRWRRSGDYAAVDLPGAPLVVMRDGDGRLRAWANTCRHRGMKLLDGDGRCKRIVCPLHAWTYALDGRLIAAPRMETCAGFARGDFNLIELRLECCDGFAFVCLDDEQQSLDDYLGDFRKTHRAWALGDWVTTRTRAFEVDCNWKLFLEIFNEYYHLPRVHPHSIAAAYSEPDACDAVTGAYTTQFGETEGSAALLEDNRGDALPPAPGLRGRNLRGARYTWVYPNLTFALSCDALWAYQAYPVTAARSRIVQTVAFPKASTKHPDFEARAQDYYRRIDLALAEDLPVLRAQQSGLTSRFAKQGRFSALEPSVANFAGWYARTMA